MRLLFLFCIFSHFCFGQAITKAYLFPGQGSDERVFSKIKLDSSYQKIVVVYPLPQRGTTMTEYAHILSKQIDTSEKYVLIGLSIGGMLCTEMADFLHPEKVIIISSAKCRSELPFHYRFQRVIPLNKIIPKLLIKGGALLLQPIVEPDRNNNKAVFKSMLKSKNPKYMKRTVNMIINWNRKTYSSKIVHIHGSNDHTIPIINVKVNYIIPEGSHMMTLTRGEELNKLILFILHH